MEEKRNYVIAHIDREGGEWLFKYDGITEAQADAFARSLHALQGVGVKGPPVGPRPVPGVAATRKANRAFLVRMEKEFLTLLQEKRGATKKDIATRYFYIL